MSLRLLILGLSILALMIVVLLYRRVRQTHPQRRIEGPNSQYRSRYVADIEAKERWKGLDLERMHRINGDEVEVILSKLRTTKVGALTASERALLDRMVEAERRSSR